MARVVAIGRQDFAEIVSRNSFYVDKTKFIKEWWDNNDEVTILTRPRRFGKTLLLSTIDHFLSIKYKGVANLFGHLSISKDKDMVREQNDWPVIFLSFADIKECSYKAFLQTFFMQINMLFNCYKDILDMPCFDDKDREDFKSIRNDMNEVTAKGSIKLLSYILNKAYNKKVVILLDEYDTPLHEIYARHGYKSSDFESVLDFMRIFFNSSFKTNPFMSRVLMTGIAYIAKQTLFSDFNNPTIISTTTNMYTDACGFTSEEMEDVFAEYDLQEQKDEIKRYYDGYAFGKRTGIYNPWSICQFLKLGELKPYWISTSSDNLITSYIEHSRDDVLFDMEDLLFHHKLTVRLEERISLKNINMEKSAFWSLCVVAGYLKIISKTGNFYTLDFPNQEVREAVEDKIKSWQGEDYRNYNFFVQALLKDDIQRMNSRLSDFTENVFSYFDTEGYQSEKFYHGFVLGLLIDLRDIYIIESNRESGRGKYDVVLIPRDGNDLNGIIIEFKSINVSLDEFDMEKVATSAIKQIIDNNYEKILIDHGLPTSRICKYAFVFKGKKVLVVRDGI